MEYSDEDYGPVQKQAEKLMNELKNLRSLKNRCIDKSEEKRYNDKISEKKIEIAIIRNRLEYHRLRAFIDCAKGMIDKDLYKKIWEEVGKQIPLVSSRSKNINKL